MKGDRVGEDDDVGGGGGGVVSGEERTSAASDAIVSTTFCQCCEDWSSRSDASESAGKGPRGWWQGEKAEEKAPTRKGRGRSCSGKRSFARPRRRRPKHEKAMKGYNMAKETRRKREVRQKGKVKVALFLAVTSCYTFSSAFSAHFPVFPFPRLESRPAFYPFLGKHRCLLFG